MKKMKEKILKNKTNTILFILLSIFSIIIITGASYALFVTSTSSEQEEMYKTGDLKVIFAENSENVINLTKQYPMTDTAGRKLTPYTFTITNEGNYNVSYTIQLSDVTTELKNSVKYQINGSSPKLLTNNTIDIGTIMPKEERNFELRLWIDNDANVSDSPKTYTGKIIVNGQAVITPYFVDNSGANEPVLASGMIPVVYDGANETWVVADREKGWYNYGDQVWANAVTVSDESLRNASVGTPLSMEVINSMWVWIPRYKYRIPSNIGSTSDVTNPPEIDVIFENGTETTGESLVDCPIDDFTCYYTHPAFRNGSEVYKTTAYDQGGWDKELSGIWVGKFETGTDNPLIKPDIAFYEKRNISTLFQTALNIAGGTMDASTGLVSFSGNSTYGLTSSTNTHMIKNTEWGAVSYLSQSKYGKMGNANYNGLNKEIYTNNSYTAITGRSGGAPAGYTQTNQIYPEQTDTSFTTYYGAYTYNDYLLNYNTNTKGTKVLGKGTGASTTGTIYGIYDMSGGKYDATMSTYNGYSGSSSSYNSGFNGLMPDGTSKSDGISFPELKYYDNYVNAGTSYDTFQRIKNASIKGDGLFETSKWYSDSPGFNVWIVRGGHPNNGTPAGIFASMSVGGDGIQHSLALRVVLIP